MKTALVTGGTTGIGQKITELLREKGWKVLTTSHRSDSGADYIVDFADKTAFLKFANDLPIKEIEAIVNNAALLKGNKEDLAMINLKAPTFLTEVMAKYAQKGAVVNLLDLAAGKDDYGYTKLALMMQTINQAKSHAHLRINGVAPGPISLPEGEHVKAPKRILQNRPTAKEVAEAVVFLLNSKSITGHIIPVDGGASIL